MSIQRKTSKDGDSENDEFFECKNEISTDNKKHIRKHSRNGSLPKGAGASNLRTCLPVKMLSKSEYSVWSILKQCIGKELSKITMPIVFNEPLSFLQRITEYMEYSSLLNNANNSNDPVERMEFIAAFAISALSSNNERLAKPFNPLLGETFELVRDDFRLISEQVSHHPPISAFHAESSDYSFKGSIYPKLKFWGKSVEVTPKGVVVAHLKNHNETYSWTNITCSIHNIIVGKMWIEHSGKMDIKCHETNWQCNLHFHSVGWRNQRNPHEVDGWILDQNEKKRKGIIGKWVDSVYSFDYNSNVEINHEDILTNPLPNQRKLWESNIRIDNSGDYYNFSNFALTLNQLCNDHKILAPTDSRFRPDIRLLEEGNIDRAASEKHRLEEKQRDYRKHKKKDKDEHNPSWFMPATSESDIVDWKFNDNYWKRDFSCCLDIY